METARGRARASVVDALNAALDAGADTVDLAQGLFALVDAIDSEPVLRRVLTEPAVPAAPKRAMLHSLLESKVSAATLEVADASVGNRWGRVRDLADCLEHAAVTAYSATAEEAGELDDLEDDLFRFHRLLEANPELLRALSDAAAPLEAKRKLLHDLIADKVGDATRGILDHVLTSRYRSPVLCLENYQKMVAERRDRLVATVWVAAPLDDADEQRMNDALAADLGRSVRMNVIVDPDVLGGARVRVGHDLIDATISTRIAQLEQRAVR